MLVCEGLADHLVKSLLLRLKLAQVAKRKLFLFSLHHSLELLVKVLLHTRNRLEYLPTLLGVLGYHTCPVRFLFALNFRLAYM